MATVFAEMADHGTRYKESAVYKTMQRMIKGRPIAGRATVERVGRQGFVSCSASLMSVATATCPLADTGLPAAATTKRSR